MIEFTNISLSINSKPILHDVSVTIPENYKTVIIGKSGCGKTVLMKTLEGLFRPDSGSISIDNEKITADNLHKRPPVMDKIAMLFQNAALLDSFTVYQNVALPLYERRTIKHELIKDVVFETLNFVGLSNSADLLPSELSGGMRKRIGLARALITNPKYIILDEPTTGLDPLTTGEVITFIKHVIKHKKVIPVTITHDPYCINELGDFVIIMDKGKVIFSGLKAELSKQSGTDIYNFYNSFFLN